MGDDTESQINYHAYVNQRLVELQTIEDAIFQRNAGADGIDETRRAEIKTIIEERRKVLNGLRDRYEEELDMTSETAKLLTDKLTIKDIMNNQLNEADKELKLLRDERLNRERLVKLGEYEYDRYRSHKNILKVIVYGILAILFIIIGMNKIPFFPRKAGIFGILLVIIIVLVSIFSRMGWNFRRTNMNWDKYDFSRYRIGEPENKNETVETDSTWFVDACKTMSKSWDDAKQRATFTATETVNAPDGFSNMVDIDTFSSFIEPSNTKNYEKFQLLF